MREAHQPGRIMVFFRKPPEKRRFFPGDEVLIPWLRNLIKEKKIGGVEKVFLNLCRSFRLLKVPFITNPSFDDIQPNDKIIVLGTGRYSLQGYDKPNKIIAGIGLMTHPSEWPGLLKDYPVAKYLQHSEWAKNVYVPYYGEEVCDTWFAGIETEKWKPGPNAEKEFDFLIYNKIRWDHEKMFAGLRDPILSILDAKGLRYKEILYGSYTEPGYFELLKKSKAMIFLCEHESQGFACCEALSMDVPVLAWDQGFCLDPNRFKWNDPVMPATSVPFFNERCGLRFKDISDFETRLEQFSKAAKNGAYSPRKYILEKLTLEKSGQRMLEIIKEVYK